MKIIKSTLWLALALSSLTQQLAAQVFELPKLPYAYDALEPAIDAKTMEIHHGGHHKAYVDNLNKALQASGITENNLTAILAQVSTHSDAVRNNAGGHYNHSLFWTLLTPAKQSQPSERLQKAIVAKFGSMDSLRMLMIKEGLSRFGSGWVWLCVDSKKQLFVSSTPNQDNPLMDVVAQKGTPIIAIDIWEHAYYLKYQQKRSAYLEALWGVLNWTEISRLYDLAAPKGKFEDWPQIVAYHKVMSHTFHASEEGNLQPVKSRHQELKARGEELLKAPIPAPFNSKAIQASVKKLAAESAKLSNAVAKGISDEKLTQEMARLHDIFHEIIGLCSNEEHHD